MNALASSGLMVAAIALFIGFLLLIAVLAFAVAKIFNRKEGEGVGCLPGCAIILALALLGILAFGVFASVMFGVAANSLVAHGPIDRIGVWVDEDPHSGWELESRREARDSWERAGTRPVHVLVDVRGEDVGDLLERLERVLERASDEQVDVTVYSATGEDGEPLRRLDFTVPLDDHEIDDLERELQSVFEDLAEMGLTVDGEEFRLPGGVWVEFRGVQRDW